MENIKITCTVNGTETPISEISEETLLDMRKANAGQRLPVASLAVYSNSTAATKDKLLLKATPEIRDKIQYNDFIAIDLRDGSVAVWGKAQHVRNCYRDIQDLTPKD